MASIIGALRVTLGLDSAAFETGAKRAEARARSMGDHVEAMGYKIGRMSSALMAAGGALVGSAVFSQVERMVTQGLAYASSLGETAQQLGVTTKALQEYRYAAGQAGIEQAEMDAALAKLTRTMGEAAAGAKTPSEAFAKLGIDVKSFIASGKDAGDLIPQIAEKLKGLSSDSERAAVLVDLFGRAGQKLMPLLSDGAAGVNNLRDAAQKLGIVLSPEQIARADEAADKYEALKTALSARIAGIVSDNAGGILRMVSAVEQLIVKFDKLMATLNAFANSPAGRFLDKLNGLASAASPLGAAQRILDAATSAPTAGGSSGGAMPRGASTGNGSLLLRKPAAGFGGRLPGVSVPNSLRANLAGNGLPGASNPLTGFAPGGKTDGWAMVQFDLENTDRWVQKLEDSETELIATNGRLKNSAKETAGLMRQSFVDSVNGITGALANLENSIRGGGFLSILSSVIGLGMQLGGAGLFGSKVAANINRGRVPAYAGGTNFHPGGLALVGERGPELVGLPRGAKVWPNGSGPGGGRTVHYHISGNLLTPDFWAEIEARDMAAARGGADGALQRGAYMRRRSLA